MNSIWCAMPCIKRLYNYGLIYLNPKRIGKFSMAGQTVDVLKKQRDFTRLTFAGFISTADLPPSAPRLKLINIIGFSHEETELGPWIDYGRNAFMLGSLINGEVWLVLDHGLPIAWCDIKRS